MPDKNTVIEFSRDFESNMTLGRAEFMPGKGWKFYPSVSAWAPSRKFHSNLRNCIPNWVKYPSKCVSYYVKYNGEKVTKDFRALSPALEPENVPSRHSV